MNTQLTIKATKGKYGLLDRAYLNHLIKQINSDDETSTRWDFYLEIIDIIINLNEIDEFKSIKYRLTGDENPNEVMLDIIKRYKRIEPVLSGYLPIIEEFFEEDWMNQFYI